jgi:hypothetical protein
MRQSIVRFRGPKSDRTRAIALDAWLLHCIEVDREIAV